MPVVTIRGQLGSGAPEVGRLVADIVHTDYVDREIVAAVAAKLRWPEQDIAAKEMPPSGLLGRIAEALERSGEYEGVYLPTWQVSLDDTRYLAGLESVIRELARSQSIVIYGGGSQFILKDYPVALHVLLVAPLEVRVKRVMESMKVDENTAKRDIARLDNSRREFIKRYFQADREDPVHYDLVINTHHLNFGAAASIIVAALPFKESTKNVQDTNV